MMTRPDKKNLKLQKLKPLSGFVFVLNESLTIKGKLKLLKSL